MNHSAASESGLTASAHGMKSHAMALVCGLALAAAGSASATTLMDQIGPSASHQQGLSNNLAQISTFYRHAAHYNASVIDDFTLADPAALSGVEAAFFAFSIRGLDGWDQLTGIRVNIFDTQPNLAMNYQLGNLFSADIPWWNIGFVSPWTTDPMTRLASIDLSGYQLTLPAGTYWLAVMALADGYSTDIGILMSSFAGAPGNQDNARQVGSGLWFGNGDRALNADAAYRITGTLMPVPEPAAYALLLAGLGIICLRARRRYA